MATATNTRLTVKDEPTREAVLLALWRTMGEPVGESTWHRIALDAGYPQRDAETAQLARAELDERLARLVSTRARIGAVARAPLGADVELDLPPGDLVDLFRDQRLSMEENADLVFGAPLGERARMLAIHDAATALLSQFEAVA
jgi:hypothetical protein